MINIGFVGSRAYTNRTKMREVMLACVEKYGKENLTIISGGCPDGADAIAKDLAMNELGLTYREYAPAHFKYNSAYMLGLSTDYNHPYSAANYHNRNEKIAKNCIIVLAFVVKGQSRRGTDSTLRYCDQYDTPTVVYED